MQIETLPRYSETQWQFRYASPDLVRQLFGSARIAVTPEAEYPIVAQEPHEELVMNEPQILTRQPDPTRDHVPFVLAHDPATSILFDAAQAHIEYEYEEPVPEYDAVILPLKPSGALVKTVASLLGVPHKHIRIPIVYATDTGDDVPEISAYPISVKPSWSVSEVLKQEERRMQKELEAQEREMRRQMNADRSARPAWSTAATFLGIGGGAIATVWGILAHAAAVAIPVAMVDPILMEVRNDMPQADIFNSNALLGARLASEALLEKDTARWLAEIIKNGTSRRDVPIHLKEALHASQELALRNLDLLSTFNVSNATLALAEAATYAYLVGPDRDLDLPEITDDDMDLLLSNLNGYE